MSQGDNSPPPLLPPPEVLKKAVPLVLLVIVPAVAAIFYVWHLHTPTPRTRTPVVITRNSLLPHRFAGPCLNCHHIQEVGPVSMNSANMEAFDLTPSERDLLRQGQRVDAPSVAQKLRVPAITRDDILPHPFVGVCSNCHVVLDIRPSKAFFRGAMRKAYQPLDTMPNLGVGPGQRTVAFGGSRLDTRREMFRNIFGVISLVLLSLMSVYVVIRMLMRSYPELARKKFVLKTWFWVHQWSATAFCVTALLHWYFSDRGNNLLHIAMLIMVWLTAAGFVLRSKLPDRKTRGRLRLLHSQRYLFVGLLTLLVVGHFFAGWY